MYQNNSTLNKTFLINKPKDWTSFDVIKFIKKYFPKRTKIGHAGTLDPFATGLLIICVGKATKEISNFMGLDKEYIVKAKLCELTDTLDSTGKIISTQNKKITKENLIDAIRKLGNKYLQIPPIYSALKYKGKPLYKLARKKILPKEELKKIAREKAREIKIKKIELLKFDFPFFIFKTTVSKGTYVRSLANDIAQKINLNATVYELERTRIGKFSIESQIALSQWDPIKSYLLK